MVEDPVAAPLPSVSIVLAPFLPPPETEPCPPTTPLTGAAGTRPFADSFISDECGWSQRDGHLHTRTHTRRHHCPLSRSVGRFLGVVRSFVNGSCPHEPCDFAGGRSQYSGWRIMSFSADIYSCPGVQRLMMIGFRVLLSVASACAPPKATGVCLIRVAYTDVAVETTGSSQGVCDYQPSSHTQAQFGLLVIKQNIYCLNVDGFSQSFSLRNTTKYGTNFHSFSHWQFVCFPAGDGYSLALLIPAFVVVTNETPPTFATSH